MLYTILFIVYVVIALAIVISLLVNGVRPAKTLAWLLAIFTIPVGGILLYLMVGRNRRKKRWEQLSKQTKLTDIGVHIPNTPQITEKHKRLIRLIQQNSAFNPSDDNEVVYLKDGRTTFETIFKALETATVFVHLQYYIFEEGELADKLLQLFRTKVQEGVKIRLIYDGVGSFSLSKPYLKKLKLIGVEVFPFLPFRFGRFLVSLNYRNHRKIIVIDGITAFTGGINISDKYLKGDTILGKWHDMHLKIEGSAVVDLNKIFLLDWQLVSGQEIRQAQKTPFFVKGSSTVQIVSSGPDEDFPAIEQAYFSIINSAERYLYITNPYIIPGQSILTALETAALSGVDVRLLISEKNDSRLVNWSVRSYFEPLLRAGVKIYLFPDGFLHSKIMLGDDAVASVGTANIDVRSFEQNYEVNALIYDPKFVMALKEDFLRDSRDSHELTYQEHQKRQWPDRLKEGFAKIFSPVL